MLSARLGSRLCLSSHFGGVGGACRSFVAAGGADRLGAPASFRNCCDEVEVEVTTGNFNSNEDASVHSYNDTTSRQRQALPRVGKRNFISVLSQFRAPFTTTRQIQRTLSSMTDPRNTTQTTKGELSSLPPDLVDPTLVDRASSSPTETSLPEDPPPPASSANSADEEFKKIYRLDYKPPPFTVDNVDLKFELNEEDTVVSARLLFRRNHQQEASSTIKKNNEDRELLELDGDPSVELLRLSLNGKELSNDKGEYCINDQGTKLMISAPKESFEEKFVVEMVTKLKPQLNTSLYGLYKSGGDFVTQCEAEGFRKIIFSIDRPDVLSVYQTTIVADPKKYPVLLSNGNFAAEGKEADGRKWVQWVDPFPKPTYLFALVAGELSCLKDSFVTAAGKNVELAIYVKEKDIDKCNHAMTALKRVMRWDEVKFGREYDLDYFNIVAVDDFNMGAMENKGLNIFNSKYILAKKETATDADYEAIESVIAHEYLHNWSGNRVTLRDWFQLSLKEGLTVFRDQEYTSDQGSRASKRIQDVIRLQTTQFTEDEGPLAHPVRPDSYVSINNFYTSTVYEKGAELIRMIRTIIGPASFRKGMDHYFKTYDGQAVTCDHFIASMEEANRPDVDLHQFKLWYSQAGTPSLKIEGLYKERQREYHLTVSQSIGSTPGQPASEKQEMHIPLAVGLLGADGQDIPLKTIRRLGSEDLLDSVARDSMEASEGFPAHAHTKVLNIRGKTQTLIFENVPPPKALSLNRGFLAPVKIETPLRDTKSLVFLMSHDSDPFNRWDASHQLCLDVGMKLIEIANKVIAESKSETGKTLIDRLVHTASDPHIRKFVDTLADAFATILQDSHLEPALVARTLSLPSETMWVDMMFNKEGAANPTAIHLSRQFIRQYLSEKLKNVLLEEYEKSRAWLEKNGNEIGPQIYGRRSLKNACLNLLVAKEQQRTNNLRLFPHDPSVIDLCWRQYRTAKNMTDELSALEALSLLPRNRNERKEALEDFYQKWQRETLVLDKWLRIQAWSCTAAEAEELTRSPIFDYKNPNKVYSLIGGFGFGNSYRFNADDGSGYRFLADQVIHLDASNPQVAARVATAFGPWKKWDNARKGLVQSQLQRILSSASISRDVREIVTLIAAEEQQS